MKVQLKAYLIDLRSNPIGIGIQPKAAVGHSPSESSVQGSGESPSAVPVSTNRAEEIFDLAGSKALETPLGEGERPESWAKGQAL
jgi:hypothetical protein